MNRSKCKYYSLGLYNLQMRDAVPALPQAALAGEPTALSRQPSHLSLQRTFCVLVNEKSVLQVFYSSWKNEFYKSALIKR